MIHTSYFLDNNDFNIAWPGRISRYDLVYQAPPSDPMQYGMPIGNGDVGALLWCDDRRIIIAVNKCDLWDDSPFDTIKDGEHEEYRTSLRHACRIVIDFGIPIFDTFYLKDFNGRVRLQDGCIAINLDTPFGAMSAEIFVAYEQNVICARIKTDFADDDGVTITLERYGSRSYTYWYAYSRRNPEIGLLGTDSACKDGNLLVSHQLTTGTFVAALRPEGADFKLSRRTAHMVSAKAEICPKEFTFFATVTTPLDPQWDADYAISVLKEASEVGFDAMLARNEACWKAFWETSFVETDDDYLDNLWHLGLYYSCAGQRGRYPGRFINSLWNWNRDVQPWNYYFHWNQQEVYWGLNATGHHELCDSYLNFRLEGMPVAQKNAEQWYGISNALFVSDIADRKGLNSRGYTDMDNHSPVVEIALDFWRQYQYTCDKEFLKEKALPYMVGAARFAASRFVKEEDGRYHAIDGSPYEGCEAFYDVVTEIGMAYALFPAVFKALEVTGVTDPDENAWRELFENLTDFNLIELDPGMRQDNGDGTFTILRGIFKGKKVNTSQILALGRFYTGLRDHHMELFVDGEAQFDYEAAKGQYVSHFGPLKNAESTNPGMDGVSLIRYGLTHHMLPKFKNDEIVRIFRGHPQATTAPIFPMGVIGLKDKGSLLFDAAVASAMTVRNETGSLCGWDPYPIVLARLGLADELDTYLVDFPTDWQYYNNGFMHYGPNGVLFADAHLPFRRDRIRDADNMKDMFYAETFPFRHMGLEPLGVLMTAMNERMLQSYDGGIRIAPAYGKHSGKFKLHAVGGFEVMAQIKDGKAEFVAIRSRYGNPLTLVNPWQEAFCNGKRYANEKICMDTVAGETYLFTPEANAVLHCVPQTPDTNMAAKEHKGGSAILGTRRCF